MELAHLLNQSMLVTLEITFLFVHVQVTLGHVRSGLWAFMAHVVPQNMVIITMLEHHRVSIKHLEAQHALAWILEGN